MVVSRFKIGGSLLKKAMVLPLSVVLAAGCAPTLAYAESLSPVSAGLKAASAPTGVGSASQAKSVTGKVALSVASSAASPQAVYLPVLLRAVGGIEEFESAYQACGDERWAPEYALFDVGNDGVPELLVRVSDAIGTSTVHVYTLRSHQAVHLGCYSEGAGGSAGAGDGRLFVAGWSQGSSFMSEVLVSGDSVKTKFMASGQASNDCFTRVGASWLKFADAAKFVSLKEQGKYDISKAKATVAAAGAYTGAAKTPAVTVQFGDEKLVSGVDFKVSYRNNVNAGAATATVTGAGSFKGSQSIGFAIAKATNSLSVKAVGKTLKHSSVKSKAQTLNLVSVAKKGQGKVKFKNVSSKSVSKHFAVNASTGTVTAKKGTPKGVYAVKIQVSAGGNGNFNASDKTVSVKVTVK